MIIYQKKWLGLFMLTTLDGSPALRALFPALASCLLAVLLSALNIVDANRDIMEHPYPYQVFCFVLGFLLVFRTTFSYNRYQLAVHNVALMTSKWGDVALQLCCFHTMISKVPEVFDQRELFRVEIVHLISLLHAVSLLKLRGDNDLNNLKAVYFDAAPHKGSTSQTGERKENAPNIGFSYSWKKDKLWDIIGSEDYISGWFDFQCNSQEIMAGYNKSNPIYVIGGLSEAERESLSKVEDRCYLVMQWVVDIVAIQGKLKLFDVEGPIVSRIYQELSDGMLGYNHARKLTEVPFPWPYAQLVISFLFIYALSVPFLMVAWIDSPTAASLFTLVVVWCYYAINEVDRDMEDPFIRGPNDLPLSIIQNDLNLRLQSLQPIDRPQRLGVISENIGEIIKQQIKLHSPHVPTQGDNSKEEPSEIGPVNLERSTPPVASPEQLRKFMNLVE